MNLLRDFCQVLDEQGNEKAWIFRFGKCEEFDEALEALKRIPLAQRIYDAGNDHLWRVTATSENEKILAEVFINFKSCLSTTRSQMRMF
jgi:hypothetical protein